MAQNVNEEIALIEDAGTFSPHPNEPFYLSAEFWVGVAFVLVVVALAKPVGGVLKNMLIKRRNSIIARIEEAQKLRDDAQLLLADYEKRFVNAQDEADAILSAAHTAALRHKRNLTNSLNAELKKRTAEAEQNMTFMLEKAEDEIYTAIGKKASAAAETYILNAFDEKKHSALIDSSIHNILKHLS